NLTHYERWFLHVNEKGCHDEWRPFRVVAAKPHGKTLIAQLATADDELIDERDVAAMLLDADIAVARTDMPAVPAGASCWHDLIGLAVINPQHASLGQVTGMLETGANVVLVVRGDDERLIPFVMGVIVDRVDVEAGLITVDWGLDY